MSNQNSGDKPLNQRWKAQPEDTIGGWCVTFDREGTPATGNRPLADFCAEETATHIANLHNEWLSKNCSGVEGQSKENHDIWGCNNCNPLTEEQEEAISKGFDTVPTYESVDMYLPHERNEF